MYESVANRAVGQYPISIATSLALEGLLGILVVEPTTTLERIKDAVKQFLPRTAPARNYGAILINIRTLIRNVIGALPSGLDVAMLEEGIYEALVSEISMIPNILAEVAGDSLECGFYYCEYSDLKRRFPRATLRVPTTPKQRVDFSMEQRLVDALKPHCVVTSVAPPVVNKPTVMLTHCPIDLLMFSKYPRLDLLESHTGAVKPRSLWYTKLYNGRNLPQLPWCKFTLQIFGDPVTFAPSDKVFRAAILDLAKKFNWNAATTDDKIRYTIGTLLDPNVKKFLLEFM